MAITWDTKITVINAATKEISLTATRTDSIDPNNPKTYTVSRAVIETGPQKIAVMDEVWAKYQADLAKESNLAGVIGSLEADANANLEAREIA